VTDSNQNQSLHDSINEQTGVIDWTELVRHFARGVVVNVAADLDLIDVAMCMARDDKPKLEQWLEEGRVNRASDDNARDWTQRNPQFGQYVYGACAQ